MRGTARAGAAAALATLFMLAAGCAGMFEPPPPLWPEGLYNSMAVLPMRVQISTGVPPLTSEDSDLTARLSRTSTEASAVALRYRDYRIFSPLEVMDRLDADDTLSGDFVELAASAGIADSAPGDLDDADVAGAAARLGEDFGVDLLVLGRGSGEFHGFGENLVQGVLTDILTSGKRQYQAPPSYLTLELVFIEAASGRRVARIYADHMSWADDTLKLARMLQRRLGRIPPGGAGTEVPEIPSP